MSRTEATAARATLAPDPAKPGIWLIPSQGGANLLFMVPLGYALYRHRYPLFNFQLGEMLETFPKMDTTAADAISVFGRYTRRMLNKLGIEGVICFGFNHLVKTREGRLMNFIAAGRIPHLSLFFTDPFEVMAGEMVEELVGAPAWRAVVLDRQVWQRLRREHPQGSWYYLSPATDPELYFPIGGLTTTRQWEADFSYIGSYSEELADLMLELGPGRLLIWGDPAWKEHPELGRRFRGSALRIGALNRIYNSTRYVLVLDEHPALAIQRALDVIAAGGVPVVRQPVLERLAEVLGDEPPLPTLTNGPDLLSLVGEATHTEWREMMLLLRERVVGEETWFRRVPRLVEILLG